jgi:hypothetical protein
LETNPYREPPVLAGLRFALELVAWIAIYFAWGWPPVILAMALLMLFNVRGDKHRVVIPIPGKLRILLELIVFVSGAVASYKVWSVPSTSAYSLAVAVMMVSSHRRMMFLWNH